MGVIAMGVVAVAMGMVAMVAGRGRRMGVIAVVVMGMKGAGEGQGGKQDEGQAAQGAPWRDEG